MRLVDNFLDFGGILDDIGTSAAFAHAMALFKTRHVSYYKTTPISVWFFISKVNDLVFLYKSTNWFLDKSWLNKLFIWWCY